MTESDVIEAEVKEERSLKRLFIGGLFPGVKEDDLESRFSAYGTIKGTEIKIRKDNDGESVKTFAYIDLEATEKDLRKCIGIYKKAKWHGRQLRVEEAKTDFMKKLDKEREEAAEFEKEKEEQKASASLIQNKLLAISDVDTAAKFNMRGATPGTKVPGQEDWVVGKYGRILPVVNLKKNGSRRYIKVDPSKLTHNVRKIKDEQYTDTVNPRGLTWQLEDNDTEIVRKRKGEFPEWKSPKVKRRSLVNGHDKEMGVYERVMAVMETDRTYRNSDFEIVSISGKSNAVNAADKLVDNGVARFDSDIEEDDGGISESVSNTAMNSSMDLARFNSDSEDDISTLAQHTISINRSKETGIGSHQENPKVRNKPSANKNICVDVQKRSTSKSTSRERIVGMKSILDEYSSGLTESVSDKGIATNVRSQRYAANESDDNDSEDSDFESFVKREMKKVEANRHATCFSAQTGNLRAVPEQKQCNLDQPWHENLTAHEVSKPRVIEGKRTLLAFRGTTFLKTDSDKKSFQSVFTKTVFDVKEQVMKSAMQNLKDRNKTSQNKTISSTIQNTSISSIGLDSCALNKDYSDKSSQANKKCQNYHQDNNDKDKDIDSEASFNKEVRKPESQISSSVPNGCKGNDDVGTVQKQKCIEQPLRANVAGIDITKPRIVEGKKSLPAFRGTKFMEADNKKRDSLIGIDDLQAKKKEQLVKDNTNAEKITADERNSCIMFNKDKANSTSKTATLGQRVNLKLLSDEFSSGFKAADNAAVSSSSADEESSDESDFETFVKKETNKINSKRIHENSSKTTDEVHEQFGSQGKCKGELKGKTYHSDSSSESGDQMSTSVPVKKAPNKLIESGLQDFYEKSKSSSSSESVIESHSGKHIGTVNIDDDDDESGDSDDDEEDSEDEDEADDDDESLYGNSSSSGSDFETLVSNAINEIKEPSSSVLGSSRTVNETEDKDLSNCSVTESSKITSASDSESSSESDSEETESDENKALQIRKKRRTIGYSGGVSESSDSDNDTDLESDETDEDNEDGNEGDKNMALETRKKRRTIGYAGGVSESSDSDNDTDLESEQTDGDSEKETVILTKSNKDVKSKTVGKVFKEKFENNERVELSNKANRKDTSQNNEGKCSNATLTKSGKLHNAPTLTEKVITKMPITHENSPGVDKKSVSTPSSERKGSNNKANADVESLTAKNNSGNMFRNSKTEENKANVDKKRLQAVKLRQQESMAQKSAIKNALANPDGNKKVNTKIVFDSDSEVDQVAMETEENSQMPAKERETAAVGNKLTKSKSLFASDEEDDDYDDSDADRFDIREEFEGSEGRKLAKLQSRFGHDGRFKLDARFIESGSEEEEEVEEEDETTRSMKILQSIVGVKAVGSLHKQDKAKKQFKDIGTRQYDPSKVEHQQFEVKSKPQDESEVVEKKKKKKKKKVENPVEEEPQIVVPEVSKEKFHEVSDALKETFAVKESVKPAGGTGFSLLAAFGRHDSEDEDIDDGDEEVAVPIPDTLRTNQLSLDNRFSVRDDTKDSDSDMDAEDLDDQQAQGEDKMDTTDKPAKPETAVRHSTFFFTPKDDRLKDGGKFPKKETDDTTTENWLEKRRNLIASYKTKHKNILRKKGKTNRRGGKRR